MKIIILTSSRYGTASHHLPYLIDSGSCEICAVILNEKTLRDRKKFYKNKIRKVFQIGLLGALNGIRMRKWFDQDMADYKRILEIESICAEYGIPFYKTDSINSRSTIDLFKRADADLGISLGNGYIGQKVFSIPKYGMINIHHEILPDFQNAQSVIWQLYFMSNRTGYTIHKIDKHIDTGEILYQGSVPMNFMSSLRQTVTKTSVSLLEASANGLLNVLKDFDHYYHNAKPQGQGRSFTTPTIWQYFRILRNFKELKKGSAQQGVPATGADVVK